MTGSQTGETRELELSGAVHRLNDGSQIAIYLRRGVAWVAHLKAGTGELYTPGEWFRLHQSPRSLQRVHEAAAGSGSSLPGAVAPQIEALHRKIESPVVPQRILALLPRLRRVLTRLALPLRRRPDAAGSVPG